MLNRILPTIEALRGRRCKHLRLIGPPSVRLGMGKMRRECSDADPPSADVILRQEPDEEEEEDEDNSNEDGNDDEDAADDGYSE